MYSLEQIALHQLIISPDWPEFTAAMSVPQALDVMLRHRGLGSIRHYGDSGQRWLAGWFHDNQIYATVRQGPTAFLAIANAMLGVSYADAVDQSGGTDREDWHEHM